MKRILLVLAAFSFASVAFSADELPVNPRGTTKARQSAPHNPNESEESSSDSYLEPMTHSKESPCAAFMGGDDEGASGMYDDARGGDSYNGI